VGWLYGRRGCKVGNVRGRKWWCEGTAGSQGTGGGIEGVADREEEMLPRVEEGASGEGWGTMSADDVDDRG
jgi:hypothetical protein